MDLNQMDPQFSTCQNRFQTNIQFYGNSGIPYSIESSSDSRNFQENGKTGFQETGVRETEIVDELLQILVECLKKADIRTQEILLRDFFFQIEKDVSLERFLVERIKHSKINSVAKIPGCSQDSERVVGVEAEMEISTREIDVLSSSGAETSEKLERFKVKTIQIGETVKEEEATRLL